MGPEIKQKAALITQKDIYEWKRQGMGLKHKLQIK